MARGQGNGLNATGHPSVSYEHGEFQWALRLLYERTGDKQYYDYMQKSVDNLVAPDGTIRNYNLQEYNIDHVRVGPTCLHLYKKTGLKKYKIAADTFRSQLETHPRNSEGQFWHKKIYPHQGWLDGIYMGDIFYADYAKVFQPRNNTAWSDIALQFKLQWEHTLQNATAPNSTQTLYHGYDNSGVAPWASADRGHSLEVWNRAVGWYAMALVDILDIFPKTHPGYAMILAQLRHLIPKLRDSADKKSGVWWLVMSQPGRAGNYFESSGAAMFIYASLKAVRLGHVKDRDGSIVKSMKKAYSYALKNWVFENPDGTMGWNNTVIVGSLVSSGDYPYYIAQPINMNDLKGAAAFVMASVEVEAL